MGVKLADNSLHIELKVAVEAANIERRLTNALFRLERVKKELTIDFGINLLKDAKYIYDAASIELVQYGNTEILRGLTETLKNTERCIGNVSIILYDLEIKGLSKILMTLNDSGFDKITKIDFGMPNIRNNVLRVKN